MAHVSVIIPTLNEADNIDSLLSRIFKSCSNSTFSIDAIVVDDGSIDGTRERVENWRSSRPVTLLCRDRERGLASAIMAGAQIAAGEILVVMDADLSHPPETLPKLVEPIIAGTQDMVIGSRYLPGGSTPGWSLPRKICSRLATILAWPLTDVRDPMSGFFAIRRERLIDLRKQVSGFKIGLELLVENDASLRTMEVPIEFHDRQRGTSKLNLLVILDYVRQLVTLAGGNVSILSGTRWALVGLLGLVADLSIFHFLFSQGVGLGPAHIAGFLVATVTNYVLNARWSFAKENGTIFHLSTRQYIAFLIIAMMALFMRGGVLATLIELWGWPTYAAILAAIGAAAVVNYFGSAFFVFSQKGMFPQSRLRWRIVALGVVVYIIALRLVYLGLPELLQEEAYYWNYAKHLDIGYLDHPPMVAWLVWLGTTLLGNSEFAIRICPFICWLTATAFSLALTKDLFDKSTAFNAILLLAILPFFFGVGFIMTPDAPLVACWAGALYFLERALIRERRLAWWGVGVCIGLGMLSKYTIALLGPATLLFLLLNRPSRRWLLAPEPYVAVLVAALLFSPVAVWNAEHEWASFAFQGPRRLQEFFQFSLHELIWHVLLLLTPTGILTVIAIVLSKTAARDDYQTLKALMACGYKFALVFLLFPLAIFLIFSLAKDVKMNWTGPLWLAIVPFMAWHMSPGANLESKRLLVFLKRAWAPTIVTAVLIYGASLHYLSLGIPGIPYPENFSLLGWNDLGRQIEQVEDEIECFTGVEPLVVGMDKYKIASGLAFYRTKAQMDLEEKLENEGVLQTAGRHLFKGDSLMYRYWFPKKKQENRNMILVSSHHKDLTKAHVLSHVDKMGKIVEIKIKKNGIYVGRYYYSIIEGYRSLTESLGG